MKVGALAEKPIKSSFLSCEKDAGLIINKLLVSSKPHSDNLKKLLIINTKDCIDNNSPNKQRYKEIIDQFSVGRMLENKYITLVPKVLMEEHSEVKAYIIITFDNFSPTSNPEFRDCTVTFDILCHTDYWDLGDFKMRPLKIAGYIDGILDGAKLTGIGTFQFLSCKELVLDEHLSGYSLIYMATHGSDDEIPIEEE
jgi:hypothetical protein